ncbi:hypothetical protein RPHASCH2410_PD00675 (plasmid) [Rhizobium phaseoli Ch24-10]|nr:hypothetical protein RPHASCH2410_PD00675 [Rhizobium phaseoli Ch24-10]
MERKRTSASRRSSHLIVSASPNSLPASELQLWRNSSLPMKLVSEKEDIQCRKLRTESATEPRTKPSIAREAAIPTDPARRSMHPTMKSRPYETNLAPSTGRRRETWRGSSHVRSMAPHDPLRGAS